MALVKAKEDKNIENLMVIILTELDHVYSNKSSDEYKMSGDITKSKMYDGIENMVAHLSQLIHFPKNEASEIRQMFNTLHRPIYKKMVTEYIHQPEERNTIFTAMFTCGYRVLVGELSRIFACTVATEKGLIYKPERVSKNVHNAKMIKRFNSNMESQIDEYIRQSHKKTKLQLQTEYAVYQEADIGSLIAGSTLITAAAQKIADFINDKDAVNFVNSLANICEFIFGSRAEMNPVSLIHYILSSNYDKKVEAFYSAQKLYEETKKAYDEYMKIPANERVKKVESKYLKLIKKYNIKMDNLRAQITHYDDRAMNEVREKLRKIKSQSNSASKPSTSKPSTDKPSTGSGDAKGNDNENKPTKPTSMDTTPDKDVNTPTNNADDLDW